MTLYITYAPALQDVGLGDGRPPQLGTQRGRRLVTPPRARALFFNFPSGILEGIDSTAAHNGWKLGFHIPSARDPVEICGT